MPRLLMWLLSKVATVAIETLMADLISGRTRRVVSSALTAAPAPAPELPAAEHDVEVQDVDVIEDDGLTPETLDPQIMVLAEMLATALEQHGSGSAVQAVLNGGPAMPGVSIVLVTQDAGAEAMPKAA